jgi:hypothetical protein
VERRWQRTAMRWLVRLVWGRSDRLASGALPRRVRAGEGAEWSCWIVVAGAELNVIQRRKRIAAAERAC